jgi:hypothetical protein
MTHKPTTTSFNYLYASLARAHWQGPGTGATEAKARGYEGTQMKLEVLR